MSKEVDMSICNNLLDNLKKQATESYMEATNNNPTPLTIQYYCELARESLVGMDDCKNSLQSGFSNLVNTAKNSYCYQETNYKIIKFLSNLVNFLTNTPSASEQPLHAALSTSATPSLSASATPSPSPSVTPSISASATRSFIEQNLNGAVGGIYSSKQQKDCGWGPYEYAQLAFIGLAVCGAAYVIYDKYTRGTTSRKPDIDAELGKMN